MLSNDDIADLRILAKDISWKRKFVTFAQTMSTIL